MVEFPSGTVPSKTMPMRDRMYLLQASVDIIQLTHVLAVDDRISDSLWYFRGYVQWHCLAVVVAELGWNANQAFSNSAWAVLDPMLSDWDAVYKSKRDDPAWEHVNDMIERARSLRLQSRPHAQKKSTVTMRNTPSMDVLYSRSASTDSPSMATYPMRSAVAETPSEQMYVPPSMQPQRYQGEALDFQQHEPQHSQQPSVSQYEPTENQDLDHYATSGAASGADFDVGDGFDDINFAAFNEVFNSQSWNLFDPMENYNSQIYEPAPYAPGYTIAPPR